MVPTWPGDVPSTRGVGLRPATPTTAARPATVLIVDDEKDILGALSLVLKRLLPGAKIVTASNGKDALAILAGEPVGVILTDYRMPAMDGFEFLDKARKIDPRVPAVMMTAYQDPQLATLAKRDHAVSLVLGKPCQTTYLAEVLRATLAGLPLPQPTTA